MSLHIDNYFHILDRLVKLLLLCQKLRQWEKVLFLKCTCRLWEGILFWSCMDLRCTLVIQEKQRTVESSSNVFNVEVLFVPVKCGMNILKYSPLFFDNSHPISRRLMQGSSYQAAEKKREELQRLSVRSQRSRPLCLHLSISTSRSLPLSLRSCIVG